MEISRARLVEYYDYNGLRLLGMGNGIIKPDQRKSNKTIIREVAEAVKKQYIAYTNNPVKYVRPRAKYIKLIKNNQVIVESVMLHDLY